MHVSVLRTSLLAGLMLAPLSAFAADRCEHMAPQDLKLDLAGAKAVVFEVNSHELRLTTKPGKEGALTGRACASSDKVLKQLRLSQQRQGDKLVVKLERENTFSMFGNQYGYLDITGTVPDNVPVQLRVGSGDASVDGASIVSADVGSGDVIVRRTRGLVAAKVASGDIEVDDAGSLKVIGISSGDLDAKHIRGAVEVGDIGSGDFDLDGATGDVRIGSIGSGGARLRDIGGSISVGSIGSGDVEARDVKGGLKVDRIGSGSVDHSNVAGPLVLPREH